MNFQPDIADGFSYRPDLIYNPSNQFVLAVGQLDPLRRAANYRPRWYTLPLQKDLPIPSFDTVREQIHVIPGSYIWGAMMLDGIDEGPPPPAGRPPATPSVAQFRIFDEAAAIQWQSDFRCFLPGPQSSSPSSATWSFVIFAEPLLVAGTGIINVEITNVSANNPILPQLVLLAAEPCAPMEMNLTECSN